MSLTINSFGNNSIYSLFGGNNSSGVNSMFGGLEGSLSSLSQIKSGSYGKLVKSYYSKFDNEGNLKSDTSKKAKAADSNLSEIRNDTADLSKATDKLLAKGKNSIWNEVETTDEDGNTTKDYDRDAIYKAVNDFAEKYNELIDIKSRGGGRDFSQDYETQKKIMDMLSKELKDYTDGRIKFAKDVVDWVKSKGKTKRG